MARLLDVTHGVVDFGYYYTRRFEEVGFYLNELLSLGHSFLVTCHASALFVDAAGEEQELHMPALQPVLFDPDHPGPVIDDLIQNIWEELTNPEGYMNIEGSGWTMIPGTNTYWVNTIRYQPNNNAEPSNRNSYDPSQVGDDPDDPPVTTDMTGRVTDTFLLSLAAHFVQRKHHHTRLVYAGLCETWLREQGLVPGSDVTSKINPTSLGEWHERVYKYNIRIFSSHGNVIYSWCPPDDNSEYINILWKNNKFSYITNLWALLNEKNNRQFCDACKKFHAHEELCKQRIKATKSINITIPEFPKGLHNCVIYADFESYICAGEHRPSGYALVLVNNEGQILDNIVINYLITEDIAEHFVKSIVKVLNYYVLTRNNDMVAIRPNICPLCGISVMSGPKTIGKNYVNGVYGTHHKDCWDDYRNCCYVMFHNFRGYDSHYVLREVMKHCNVDTLRGKSFEKFDLISCTANMAKFTFKDTFNFLSYSLATLVKNVTTFHHTPPQYRHSKGVFPYDWFDNPNKLRENALPSAVHWYNKLTGEFIDPTPAREVWLKEEFRTFGEYHNFYMNLDVLQLCDVFEEFRFAVHGEFQLDPIYCQGSPSLTWQLCLEQCGKEIKLIKDISVYLDIQKNIRGGISQVMTRHMNTLTRGGSILYLDINSLYSACMEDSVPLLYCSEIKELPTNWQQFADPKNEYTALLCVDLIYPAHLHDAHRYYPLAPHKYNGRLCTTFLDKNFYLTHARNLKFYTDNGMIIGKFHYGYIFTQGPVLKKYVKSNIEKRKEASALGDKVRVGLYKLLNNSLYGKTCENKFKYRKYAVKDRFVGIWGKTNPFMFKSRNWLEINDKILCEQDNSSVRLDKPIQIGFTVLEFAKLKMYEFVYALQKYFPEVQLLYTDTDSLMMWFPYPEPQKKLVDSPLAPKFDFEKSPEWFNVRTINTDKVSGLWSLEADKPIVEFIGLRAKTYAIRYQDGTTTLKNKGIIKSAKESEEDRALEFIDYARCLYEDKQIYVDQILIRSKLHSIHTMEQRKLALSSYDSKRAILADKITTLPFGYQGERYADASTIQPSSDNL